LDLSPNTVSMAVSNVFCDRYERRKIESPNAFLAEFDSPKRRIWKALRAAAVRRGARTRHTLDRV
jgi:hypothetical protein